MTYNVFGGTLNLAQLLVIVQSEQLVSAYPIAIQRMLLQYYKLRTQR